MDEQFDLDAWKRTAEQALEGFLVTHEMTAKTLTDLEAKIAELRNALGIDEGSVKRTRLRSPILKILAMNEEPVMVTAIVAMLAVDGVTEEQVLNALRRTLAACPEVTYSDERCVAVRITK